MRPDSNGFSYEDTVVAFTAFDLLSSDLIEGDSVQLDFIFFIEPSGIIQEAYAFPNVYPDLEAMGIEQIMSWKFDPIPDSVRQKVKVSMNYTPRD